MAQVAQAAEPAFVGGGRQRVIRYQRYHGCLMAGSDLPQMQIGYAVALALQPVADDRFKISIRIDVQQHGAGRADQTDGQLAITRLPMIPTAGSAQTQFEYIATTKAAMAKTDVAASAMTWT